MHEMAGNWAFFDEKSVFILFQCESEPKATGQKSEKKPNCLPNTLEVISKSVFERAGVQAASLSYQKRKENKQNKTE